MVSPLGRLAFSCIWEINDKAEIVKTRFTKSVINSKVEGEETHTFDNVTVVIETM